MRMPPAKFLCEALFVGRGAINLVAVIFIKGHCGVDLSQADSWENRRGNFFRRNSAAIACRDDVSHSNAVAVDARLAGKCARRAYDVGVLLLQIRRLFAGPDEPVTAAAATATPAVATRIKRIENWKGRDMLLVYRAAGATAKYLRFQTDPLIG